MNNSISKLDAEILLAHVLQKNRSYLHAWPEQKLEDAAKKRFMALVKRRLQGEPIAYLTGHREFWSLDLMVTKETLIPRPETELLVELTLQKIMAEKSIIADLGTGSGAIALALASERPAWEIHATDKSQGALQVAELNAARLHLPNIIFHEGSWCEALPRMRFDAIVSNPPYIAENDPHLHQDVFLFEPPSALISGCDGLEAIRQLIGTARDYLKAGGYLLLEHGFQQANEVKKIFAETGYTDVTICQDLAGLDRVTIGRLIKVGECHGYKRYF